MRPVPPIKRLATPPASSRALSNPYAIGLTDRVRPFTQFPEPHVDMTEHYSKTHRDLTNVFSSGGRVVRSLPGPVTHLPSYGLTAD